MEKLLTSENAIPDDPMLACLTLASVCPFAVTEMNGAAAAVAATPCRNRRLEMLVITTEFTTNTPRALRKAEEGAGRLDKSVRTPQKSDGIV